MNHKTQLVKLLEQKYGKAKLSGTEWIRIPCPTCNEHDRKKMKRFLTATSNTSHCFICGVYLDVRDMLNGSFFAVPKQESEPEKEKKVDPRALQLPYHTFIPINELPIEHPAVQFLFKDKLFELDNYYKYNRIVYVPVEGGKIFHQVKPFITSAERLVFPVYCRNNLVGWQMRSIPGTFYGSHKDCVRYYHLFDKGNYLYNFDQAKTFKRVVVVEGVKKALKFPNGVATLGACITKQQLHLIAGWDEIVMMLDAEDHNKTQARAKDFVAGLKAANKDAINIDLRPYGAVSPDELDSTYLQQIVDYEWTLQHI